MRSKGTAYLFLLLFGLVGGHKFYLRNWGSGFLYILLFVLGGLLSGMGIGLFFFGILLLLCLYDFFTLPKQVGKAGNAKLKDFAPALIEKNL